MNFISDILFWISTGLLVPVIVLLILLFIRSLLLVGSFFGQYLNIRKNGRALRTRLEGLTPLTVASLEGTLPRGNRSISVRYLNDMLAHKDSPAHVRRILADFEIAAAADEIPAGHVFAIDKGLVHRP